MSRLEALAKEYKRKELDVKADYQFYFRVLKDIYGKNNLGGARDKAYEIIEHKYLKELNISGV